MLFAVTECIGQAKWLLFQKRPEHLIDFHNIDEASRGPWSAFKVVFQLRGRAILASLGALVFVLSLAVDPFIQQVLSYPSKSNITSEYPRPTFPLVTTWAAVGSVDMGIASEVDGDLSKSPTFDTKRPEQLNYPSLSTATRDESSNLRDHIQPGNFEFDFEPQLPHRQLYFRFSRYTRLLQRLQ